MADFPPLEALLQEENKKARDALMEIVLDKIRALETKFFVSDVAMEVRKWCTRLKTPG